MALDSIAQLAVIITGDEAPLTRATRRAEDSVKRFQSIGNATGSVGMLKSLAGALGFGGVAGAFAVATGAAIRFTTEATRGAIEAESAAAKMNKSWTETEKRIRTTAGQWEIFKQGVTTPVKDTLGSILAKDLREALTMINVATGAIQRFQAPQLPGADLSASDIVKSRYDQLVARAKAQGGKLLHEEAEEAKKLADILKDRRTADWWKQSDKDIADTQKRIGLQMEEQAKQLKDTLRTPLEAYEAKLEELRQLQDAGMIGAEMMQRATDKARADMENANQMKERVMQHAQGPIAAAERYTMAGYSAGLPQQKDDKREEKQLVNQGQQLIQVMQHIDAQLAGRPDWPAFQISKLN